MSPVTQVLASVCPWPPSMCKALSLMPQPSLHSIPPLPFLMHTPGPGILVSPCNPIPLGWHTLGSELLPVGPLCCLPRGVLLLSFARPGFQVSAC